MPDDLDTILVAFEADLARMPRQDARSKLLRRVDRLLDERPSAVLCLALDALTALACEPRSSAMTCESFKEFTEQASDRQATAVTIIVEVTS
jgi:hypothetical protein